MSLHFVIKCVLNHRIRGKLCVQYKMNPFWAFVVVNYCNLWYPVISVRKWNVCYFFLIFCYQMKCPYIWKIYLPLFFLYICYSCHTSSSKYKGTIWTTLYIQELLHKIFCKEGLYVSEILSAFRICTVLNPMTINKVYRLG